MAVIEREAPVDLHQRLIHRAWEDEQFAELLRINPRAAIAEETGVALPGNVDVRVHQADETTFHLVVPMKPSTQQETSDTTESPQQNYSGHCIRTSEASGCAATRQYESCWKAFCH